jgi:hypothetical protein
MRVDKFTVRRFVVFSPLLVALLWAGWWGLNKAVEPPRYRCDTPAVNVEKGDTIDGIARRHCQGEVSAVIDTLVAMYGTRIDTWQTIHLPIASPRSTP